MGQWVPSLGVFHPVANVTEEDMAYVEGAVAEAAGDATAAAAVHERWRALDRWRATIIGKLEGARFQRRLGSRILSPAQIGELAEAVGAALPVDGVDTLTLPVEVRRAGNGKNYKNAAQRPHLLTVTESQEVTRRRGIARRIIYDFTGVRPAEVSSKVWLKDDKAVPVPVALAATPQQKETLEQMKAVMMSGAGSLLPANTELGAREIILDTDIRE